jgi:hypothetical protein
MNYFDRQIQVNQMFGAAMQLGRPTKHNAKQWIERIECDLSPENLSCDGELRGLALLRKRRELDAALQHCQNLLSVMPDEGAKDGDRFMGFADSFSLRAQYNKARRDRTQQRESKLIAAVQDGFTVGARVLISNGTTGTIIKINRTRVKVKGDDQRLWSVPPRCMELLKVR